MWHASLTLCLMATWVGLSKSQDTNSRHNRDNEKKGELAELRQTVSQLVVMLDMVKAQNADLASRVAYLETCECRPTKCYHDYRYYNNDERWTYADGCQECHCANEKVECEVLKLDHCQDPCSCQNGGTCLVTNGYETSCECTPGCYGNVCQHRGNPCLHLPDAGSCDEHVDRYHYDDVQQRCRPFVYSGCGGNANNFETLDMCEDSCVYGACCYLMPGDLDLQHFCEVLDVRGCHGLAEDSSIPGKETIVLSFKPGASCQDGGCLRQVDACAIGNVSHPVGARFKMGCDMCTCEHDGTVVCSCEKVAVRKELRDLSPDEMLRFQQAVQQLKQRTDDWDSIRDLYSQHVTLANHRAIFLPWHRAFLHYVEQKLQEVDCTVAIPYFDFTADAGDFARAVVWQANFFGGNSSSRHDEDQCVRIHPFGEADSWQPCIQREFNTNITLPTLLEVAAALRTQDYVEMSRSLQTIVAYMHVFTGGTMLTSHAAYDPVFLPFHAFIDMVFWEWQHSFARKWPLSRISYPGEYWDIPMPPFQFTPSDVMDSEALCVTYALQSRGTVCNDTKSQRDLKSKFLLHYRAGYDDRGFDSIGYNVLGFNRQGYDRDGYDMSGFDVDGYDRLGFDLEGFSRWGHNRQGVNRTGHVDESGVYGPDGQDWVCLDRSGYSVHGYDQYGFDRSGYNRDHCNHFYHGPYSPLQLNNIWHGVERLDRSFLTSLPRTCSPLQPLPSLWLEQSAIIDHKDITNAVPCECTSTTSQPITSQRFCFDTTTFLSNCPCGEDDPYGFASCTSNPCLGRRCPMWPDAKCRVDLCSCQPYWAENGIIRECHQTTEEVDYCNPNPCQNGGTCTPSAWPAHPAIVQCECSPGWLGAHCQFEATSSETCSMPLLKGDCDEQHTRWHYDTKRQACELFVYTGCHGNSNNFPSYQSCVDKCLSGACCYRRQLRDGTYGFDPEGYDRYGFNVEGINREGNHRVPYNSISVIQSNPAGEFDGYIGFDETDYDAEGFNREGFNCYGYNRDHLDRRGLIAGYKYQCVPTSISECLQLHQDHMARPVSVVSFQANTSCDNAGCVDMCGCTYHGIQRQPGETFTIGCNECTCEPSGSVHCRCTRMTKRKAIHDLTPGEWEAFQQAVQAVARGRPSKWDFYARLYQQHYAQFLGAAAFLPWHRYFLRMVETELQKKSCSVSIPYFDWTTDVGRLNMSLVWQANAFGGNGGPPDLCVRFHPFQDNFDPWAPCLTRSFNTNFSLPDLINIHLMLKEETYSNFQAQMEVASALFHIWVGGHMATDMAAYDPVFLAHFAYIDKIWKEWQVKHPDTYPRDLLYTPMAPFKNTPDQVMSSEEHMCVTYVELGAGANCNTTWPATNKPDDEEYNKNGFDANGYDEKGQDSQGFSRNGNGVDSYDRDGYDLLGYDHSGYDRYGYHRNGYTPFGLHKNGSTLPGRDVSEADIFDEFGYNTYGLNKFGYDRHGFDIFGYDHRGLDINGCPRHNSRPTYVGDKFWVEEQLHKLDWGTLGNISRICEPMTSLPEIWPQGWRQNVTNWIQRWNRWHSSTGAENRNSSLTKDGIWLPNTNDDRFCFNLYRYSGCPVGQPPIRCEQHYCAEQVCEGQPMAICRVIGCGDKCEVQWYDGITGDILQCAGCLDRDGDTKKEGSVWRLNPCQVCKCQGGEISCSDTVCPVITCSHPVRQETDCCPTCQGCQYWGQTYVEEAKFSHPHDPCQTCSCHHGNVTCDRVACPPQHGCKHSETPEDQCCPQCLDSDCWGHPNGSTWKENKCTHCTCVNGEKICERMTCPPIDCTHPVTPTEQCCPRCKGCFSEGRRYGNGEKWQPDNCRTCRCLHGNIKCITKSCPPIFCSAPFTTPGECCSRCIEENCKYNGVLYKHEAVFTAKYNKCLNCSCKNGMVNCRPLQCPDSSNLSCELPVVRLGDCCPSHCPECLHEGTEYTEGDIWNPNGYLCQQCSCRNGVVSCDILGCEHVTCEHGSHVNGTCCRICDGCYYDGQEIANGQKFVVNGDQCSECVCNDGNVKCRRISRCPALECVTQELPQGSCCPVCKAACIDVEGVPRFEGITWRNHNYPCRVCQCVGQEAKCGPVECDTKCLHPLPARYGGCCPTCSGCVYDGQEYRDSEQVHSADRCKQCTCSKGSVKCSEVACPALTCPRSISPQDGGCCPVCPACVYHDETFENGTSFVAPRNPCLRCVCMDGQVDCERLDLDCQPHCPHPARVYGQCCPLCNGCEYQRRRFHNGQEFHVPDSPCDVCICQDGRVTCKTRTCPVVNCVNPFQPEGKCCPVCPRLPSPTTPDSFEHRAPALRTPWTLRAPRPTLGYHGAEPTTPGPGPYTTGSYMIGEHRAPRLRTRTPRPETSTPEPFNHVLNPDIPEPYACIFDGNWYSDGHVFQLPSDHCSECRCQKGRVKCHEKVCTPTNCVNPRVAEGECCPVCPEGCEFSRNTYRDGESFTSTVDPCQMCTCKDSQVECQPKPCDSAQCPDPVTRPNQCCPTCPMLCQHAGAIYREGQMFISPTNKCQTCQCKKGQVSCNTIICVPVECDDPVTPVDKCCASCPRPCSHDGLTYKDGETFVSSKSPCQQCSCQNGHVTCIPTPCPEVYCENPVVLNGECCPTCPLGCTHEQRKYEPGEIFSSQSNRCEQCECKGGRVTCRKKDCPEITCRQPYLAPDACCPRCQECHFKKKTFQNGETFSHPSQRCQECICKNGNVDCTPELCPPVDCPYPTRPKEQCCPVCETVLCKQQGNVYKPGQTFNHPDRPCELCTCQADGDVLCAQVQCPEVTCDHPMQEMCCLTCNGCVYQGQVYKNTEKLNSPEDPCQECRCVSGNVKCAQKACPHRTCLHPGITPEQQCCPECTDCLYDDVSYKDQESFPLSSDSCTQCICSSGTVTCQRRVCDPVSCTHPTEGDCCPQCDGCVHHSQRFSDGQKFVNSLNVCEDCKCNQGNVTCEQMKCPRVACKHPVQGHCCPECTDCVYEGKRIRDGTSFPNPVEQCQICTCQRGTVRSDRRLCPEVNCVNPVQGPCCLTCPGGCFHHGRQMQEGEVAPHRTEPCMQCACHGAEVQCYRKKCQDPQCSHPYIDECGCTNCTHCLLAGDVIGQGQRVAMKDDPCQMCVCQGGNVDCEAVECPVVKCQQPVYSQDSCCPQCLDCEYKGHQYNNGTSFSHPIDPCASCHCLNGEVSCERKSCPAQLECTHPVPGKCCPKCDRCKYMGQLYADGQHFRTDSCVECMCKSGNVTCEHVVCPELMCPRPKRVPGVCCPTCGGCIHQGLEHALGSSWLLIDNPCVTCRCEKGITFCEETECRAPCEHPMSVAGMCCPVCPGCYYSGVQYTEGEIFSPTGDPCDTCTCQNDNMVCKKQSCPSKMLCEDGSYTPVQPGQCCPLCAQARTQCSADKIGLIVRSEVNPCHTCQCKAEYNWFCMRETCPPLSCEPEEQLVTPGECCPHCISCFVAEEQAIVQDGEMWISPRDPCLNCECQDGEMDCLREQCRPLVCPEGSMVKEIADKCCPECASLLHVSCQYDGSTLQPGEQVLIDECTQCTCKDGSVECHTQRCVQPNCAADEIPSLLPGVCCPVCLPKPATCIIYGDPHYRTFDGAPINFQGMCRYVMTADCQTGHFVVEAEHDDRNTGLVSWVKSVTLKLGKFTIDLLQGREVQVNKQSVKLPFLLSPELYIEQKENTVLLNTAIGLRIQWNGDSYVEISVPGTYKGATCGLCGNFNNFPQDDMRLKSGVIVSSAATFGNSWQVGDEACAAARDSDPCMKAGYRVRKMANTKCAILKMELFQRCHRVISPESYFASCVYDLCACEDPDRCLCEVLSTYALECGKAGVSLNWRSHSLCAVGCPKERGFMFDECGPACPRTCDDSRDVSGDQIDPRCLKPCVPGCQCPAHLVLYRDHCIPMEDCPVP